jgi:7,8-dihydropterin-6-yl-methyl-4-(beta-D-ribofuranosyl)aminobenzene 5'-phosphate synthase
MKVTVLSESKAIPAAIPEHGLSYLIEEDGNQFLFDTGASDIFLKNARTMGIDPGKIQMVILSHGHYDHGDGLQYLERKTLLCHPGCFVKRVGKQGSEPLGLALSRGEIEEKYTLILSREPYQLSEHLIFLGEIPRKNDFESRVTPYRLEDGGDDFILDDSGLACMTPKGLVVISGCAHSGICNMVEYAMEITGSRRVEAVMGGFHLKQVDDRTQRTIKGLRQMQVNRVLPSHCTREPALTAFHQAFGKEEVRAGEAYYF